jgi:hypothetical protein
MENPLQDKIQDLLSLRKEGWGDSKDGSMTSTHTNYYSHGNNENDITKVSYSVEPLKYKKGADNLKKLYTNLVMMVKIGKYIILFK